MAFVNITAHADNNNTFILSRSKLRGIKPKEIKNNKDKIVNYRERKNRDLPFTSNLAESTVESLINQRCKRQQHMRWTREGLNPILKLRARIHSKDWESQWRTAVLNYAA